MTYGHLEKEYSEENDCSLAQAYSDLHCDCEDEINYTKITNHITGQVTIEFDSIQDYIRWFKKFGKEK